MSLPTASEISHEYYIKTHNSLFILGYIWKNIDGKKVSGSNG